MAEDLSTKIENAINEGINGVIQVGQTVQDAVDSGNYSNLSRDVAKGIESMFSSMGRSFDTTTYRTPGTPDPASRTSAARNPNWQQTRTYQEIQRLQQQRAADPRMAAQMMQQTPPRQAYVQPQPFVNSLYKNLSSDKLAAGVGSVMGIAAGAIITIMLMPGILSGGMATFIGLGLLIIPALAIFGGAVGAGEFSLIERFEKIVKALGDKTYADIGALAAALGKPEDKLKKDLKKMLKKGWFTQGNLDSTEKTLITSAETYQHYLEAEKAAKEREEEESIYTPEQREMFRQGEEFIKQLRECNDLIPGEEVSGKLDRMEHSVRQILDRAKEQPHLTEYLRRLMSYYLPTMVKLLNSYIVLDKQEKSSSNIESSKKEIESTIDVMNDAFDKLFDGLFDDTSLDISTDAEVMRMMLEQEGLTGRDFSSTNVISGNNN